MKKRRCSGGQDVFLQKVRIAVNVKHFSPTLAFVCFELFVCACAVPFICGVNDGLPRNVAI